MRHVALILASAILGGSIVLSAYMVSYAIDKPTELEQARDYCSDAPTSSDRDTCIFRVLTDNNG